MSKAEPPILFVVEKPEAWPPRPGRFSDDPYSLDWLDPSERWWLPHWSTREHVPLDPNGADGEWHAYITLPHEVVEWDGHGVPLFEGDVERREWEERRRARRQSKGRRQDG